MKLYLYSFQIKEYGYEMKNDEWKKRMKWINLKMKWNERRNKNELFVEMVIFIFLKYNYFR